jgi:hypothetical protein
MRRLKLLFRVFRVFNLVWIVLCAVFIEMTLNENHMLQTVAKYGHIAFPAQLLPLLVGVLSFLRVLWLIMMDWVELGDEKAANEDPDHPVHPHRSAYAKTLRGGLRLLPPWTNAKRGRPPVPTKPEDNIDRHKPIHYRILVGYLPWLSVFPFWRRELRDVENQSTTHTPEMTSDVKNTDVTLNEDQTARKLD